MTKREFLAALEARLSGLPEADKRESLEYYSEIIADRIDDGLTEEEAVAAVGSLDSIVGGILSDVPLTKIVKEKVKPKRKMNALEIVFLILGAPIWLSLVLALVLMVLSCYLVLWSVVVTFYTVTLSLGIFGLTGVAGIVFFGVKGELMGGLFLLGAGLVCAGLAILFFYLSSLVAKGVITLGKAMVIGMKRLFVGKETVK